MSRSSFVDHLVFRVRNLNETRRFYTIVLDQEPVCSEDSIMYQVGDTRLFFTSCKRTNDRQYEKENVGLNHVAFGVRALAELDSVQKRLDLAKVVHSGIKKDHYGQKEFIWLDDPDNMRLEFYVRPLP
ncbi:MAG TPA: VOC family protein [Terriglobales bacterium]|nr:VOC family protein [Terriglobales bacterium]